MERAMGIEPKRTALQSLLNATFREAPPAACEFSRYERQVGLRDNSSVCHRVSFDPVPPLMKACRGGRRRITTPTGDTGKTVRITARPATIARDKNVLLAAVASSNS
jgi:hypothetical protein